MRMTASWFGSLDPPNTRLWRDRSALERGLPSDRHLADPARLRSTVQPCSELSGGRGVELEGGEKRAFISNKELTKEERCVALLKLLDKKSPIQGVPVAVVVISSNGEGDRSVESLEVKVPGDWGSIPV